MAGSLSLMPLLFSRIPPDKFGTVSSGFGVFGSITSYVLGNVGGFWVHAWTGWVGATTPQYTAMWLLQTVVAAGAMSITLRCLRPIPAGPTGVTQPAPDRSSSLSPPSHQ
jgi:hypothetical protein